MLTEAVWALQVYPERWESGTCSLSIYGGHGLTVNGDKPHAYRKVDWMDRRGHPELLTHATVAETAILI